MSSSPANKVEFLINLYEAGPAAGDTSSAPTCTVELHLRHRYKLRIPSNEGVLILVEDILTPEWRTSVKLPLLSWRDHCLSDLFSGLNLDPSLLACLRSKVAEAADSLAARPENRGGSFGIVAKVAVLKNELLSKEETDRLAAEFANPPDKC